MMEDNNDFEISIGEICDFHCENEDDRDNYPENLMDAVEAIVYRKKLYLSIDALCKLVMDEDLKLLKGKYRAECLDALRKNPSVQFIWAEEERGNKKFQEERIGFDNIPKTKVYYSNMNAGYHCTFMRYILKPKDLFEDNNNIFFSYKLRGLDLFEIDNFLEYYLLIGFEKDFQRFQRYLQLCLRKYRYLFKIEIIETINEWVNSKEEKLLGNNSGDENNQIKPPPIAIHGEYKIIVFNAIKNKFDNNKNIQDDLKEILSGKDVLRKFVFKDKAQYLIMVFRLLHDNKKLINKTKTTKWLRYYFKYKNGDDKITPFNEKYVKRLLSEEVYADENFIKIKELEYDLKIKKTT